MARAASCLRRRDPRQGLALAELGHGRIRAVTHAGLHRHDVDRAIAIIKMVWCEGAA